MFHEDRELISKMKNEDKHFKRLFDRHNELDENITELVKKLVNEFEIEKLKKEKLKLKDQIHTLIVAYKNK